MTNIEKAIAYFEDAIRESAVIIGECPDAERRASLREQRKHFETALAAMKEVATWRGSIG